MAAPATPANLLIDVIASNCLKLSWDNVAGETHFYLYKSLDDATYGMVAVIDADTLVFWDKGVAPGTQYYYKISAYNGDGESALSASVNDTTLAKSTKKVWRGGVGPFLYDENAIYAGEDISLVGIRSEDTIRADVAPSEDEDVLRKADLGSVFAPHDAQYIVVALDGDLDSERRLQANSPLSLTDGGANGDIDIDLVQGSVDHGSIGGLGDDDHTIYILVDGSRVFTGGIQPASLADGSASNNTIYYSTTQSKLVYKDSGGVVNDLY